VTRADVVIPIPAAERLEACQLEESGWFKAFQSQFRSAETLLQRGGLEHEAVSALRLSIECFLKHVLCAARWFLVGKKRPDSAILFQPKDLQHDLRGLAEWTGRLFIDLRDDTSFRQFPYS
jgi:hypothetical protein